MTRRRVVGAIAALVLGIVALAAASSGERGSAVAPEEGALFAAWARADDGRGYATAREDLERGVGRRFDAYRWWIDLDDPVDERQRAFMRDLLGDRIPVLGFTTQVAGGGMARWGDVAAGRYDDRLRRMAQGLDAYGGPMVVVVHHEPEDDLPEAGSAEDYVRMFRHVAAILRAHAPQVEIAWVLMAITHRDGRQAAYYPGDEHVDWIGADGYNLGRPWRSCATVFGPFAAWAERRDRPLLIAEMGTNDDPAVPDRSARWLDECRAWVRDHEQIKLVAYFHTSNWVLEDNGGQALRAFRAWGQDPYFRRAGG